jgi:hypothetical protein
VNAEEASAAAIHTGPADTRPRAVVPRAGLRGTTVAVVVPDVLGQDTAEIPFAEDQHVIQALAA